MRNLTHPALDLHQVMKGLISTRWVKLKVAAAMFNRMKRFEDFITSS